MRTTSHTQKKEPLLEYLLSELRFRKVCNHFDKNSTVADLGCGYNGNMLKRISGKIKNGVGYDVSISNNNLPKNIVLKKTNLNGKIDSKNNFFDIVSALAVLEHVEKPKNFLKQVKVMLKKRGKIIVTTPHKRGKNILEFLSTKLHLISSEEIKDHKNYFDEKSMKILFSQTGFKILKLETFEFGYNLFCLAQKIS